MVISSRPKTRITPHHRAHDDSNDDDADDENCRDDSEENMARMIVMPSRPKPPQISLHCTHAKGEGLRDSFCEQGAAAEPASDRDRWHRRSSTSVNLSSGNPTPVFSPRAFHAPRAIPGTLGTPLSSPHLSPGSFTPFGITVQWEMDVFGVWSRQGVQ